MDANEVLGVVEWALGGFTVVGLSFVAWFHRRVSTLEHQSNDLEPIRKILEEESLNAARRLAKGVKR
jgi:hypothetical protein